MSDISYIDSTDDSNSSNDTYYYSTPIVKDQSCFNIKYILFPAIGFAGIFLNLLNVIVFLNPKLYSLTVIKMNKLLLFKSISDMQICFNIIVYYLINCSSICEPLKSIVFIYFELIYSIYLAYFQQLSSMFIEVLVTLDRYVIMSHGFKSFKNLNYKYLLILVYLYPALFSLHQFFEVYVSSFEDKAADSNITTLYYSIDYTEFGLSLGGKIFASIYSIQRDVVCVLLIIVLNVMIFLKMREILSKKRQIKCNRSLTTATSTTTTASQKSIRSNNQSASRTEDKAELKLIIMVCLTGAVAVVSHALRLVSNTAFYATFYNECFQLFEFTAYYLSFTINFFFYIAFNNVFRDVFLEVLKSLFRIKNNKPSV